MTTRRETGKNENGESDSPFRGTMDLMRSDEEHGPSSRLVGGKSPSKMDLWQVLSPTEKVLVALALLALAAYKIWRP